MIIAIVGPTASKKSSLAINIAKKFSAVIVNFDAYQMYRELTIGVNRPTEEEMNAVPHYFIANRSFLDGNNIASFQREGRELLDKLINEKKNVVLVGGSGLYLRALLYDYSFLDIDTSKINLKQFDDMDDEQLHFYLKKIDSNSAEKIHPHNRRRVLRAIAIYLASGRSKSDIEKEQKHDLVYDCFIVGLNPPRQELYTRIEKRTDWMFDNGLLLEAQSLMNEFPNDYFKIDALGYEEAFLYLKNEISLKEAKEIMNKKTKNYAKRQITFFKHQFDVNWCETIDQAERLIEGKINE